MRIKILNGPNINMLGLREVSIYGNKTYLDLENLLKDYCDKVNIDVDIIQSNYEGKIIDEIQSICSNDFDALIINPGAFTHYSYAIRDALSCLNCLKIEVHLSDIYNREQFRSINVIKDVVHYSIIGKGFEGYIDAVKYVEEKKKIDK